MKKNPKSFKAKSGSFQFLVKGPIAANWIVSLNRSPGGLRRGKSKTANTTFTVQDKHLLSIYKGKQDFSTAIIQGKVVVIGDKDKAENFAEFCDNLLS